MKQENKTLLIMAAGISSRFGSLKQIEPIGPNGEFLIDYSIYDAIRYGFNKVVFIIKKEYEQIFKDTIGNRINNVVKVEYVFQDINNLPSGYNVPEGRKKPWGTAHAILCAKDKINEPFVTINADDFYGAGSYRLVSKFLDANNQEYCIVGYKVSNTLSKNGKVKRGILEIDKDGNLVKIKESSVEEGQDGIVASPLDEEKKFILDRNTLVSMNMLVLNTTIFNYLENKFKIFLDKYGNDLEKEFLIPDVLFEAKLEEYKNIEVLSTDDKWYGVTYKEDKEIVQNSILELIADGIYPYNLWNN